MKSTTTKPSISFPSDWSRSTDSGRTFFANDEIELSDRDVIFDAIEGTSDARELRSLRASRDDTGAWDDVSGICGSRGRGELPGCEARASSAGFVGMLAKAAIDGSETRGESSSSRVVLASVTENLEVDDTEVGRVESDWAGVTSDWNVSIDDGDVAAAAKTRGEEIGEDRGTSTENWEAVSSSILTSL